MADTITLASALYGPSGPRSDQLGPTPGNISGGQAAPRSAPQAPAQARAPTPAAPAASSPSTPPRETPQPRSLGEAMYGAKPAETAQGPKGMDGGQWRGADTSKLPGVEADPRSVAAGSPPAQPEAPDTPFDPGKYTPPEGVEVMPEMMQSFGDVARELKVGQKGAERLMALHTQAQEAALDRQGEQWRAQTMAHYGEAANDVARGITEHLRSLGADGNAVIELMQTTRLGNNLAVLRTLDALVKGRR